MPTIVFNNGGNPSSSVESSVPGYGSCEPQVPQEAQVTPNSSSQPNTPGPAAAFYTDTQCRLPSAFQPKPDAANGEADLFGPPQNPCSAQQRLWPPPDIQVSPVNSTPTISDGSTPWRYDLSAEPFFTVSEKEMSLRMGSTRTIPTLQPGDSVVINGNAGKYRVRCIVNFAGEPLIGVFPIRETIIRGADGRPQLVEVEDYPRWIYENAGLQYLEEVAVYRVGNRLTFMSYSALPDIDARVEMPGLETFSLKPGHIVSPHQSASSWNVQIEPNGDICIGGKIKTVRVIARGETYLIDFDSDGEFLRAIHERRGISTAEYGRFGMLEITDAGVRYSPFRVDAATGQITTFEPTFRPFVDATPRLAGMSVSQAINVGLNSLLPAHVIDSLTNNGTIPLNRAVQIEEFSLAGRTWCKIIGVNSQYNVFVLLEKVGNGNGGTLRIEMIEFQDLVAASERPLLPGQEYPGVRGGTRTLLSGLRHIATEMGFAKLELSPLYYHNYLLYKELGFVATSASDQARIAAVESRLNHKGITGLLERSAYCEANGLWNGDIKLEFDLKAQAARVAAPQLPINLATRPAVPFNLVGRSPILPEAPETTGAWAGCAERPTMPVANACGLGDVPTAAHSWSEVISSIVRGVRHFISSTLPGEAAIDVGTADTLLPEAGPSAKQYASSEKTSSLDRTVAGFFGGLAAILGLHEAESLVGLSDIPVIGKLLEGLNFFGGHVVGTSIGTGMSLSEAAILPQSLESFYRSGGTFMLLMPGIIKGLRSAGSALGLDPEDMNGIEFQAAAVAAGIGTERGVAAIGELAGGYLERKGLTGAAELVSRLFTRAIPGLGWGLLVLDAAAELPALVHAYGQGVASLMGIGAFDFNKGVLLAQRYYDMRAAKDPVFGTFYQRPDNYIAARNILSEAANEELDILRYEIDSEFYQRAYKLRTALNAVLAELVIVDMADNAKRQSVRPDQKTVEDMIRNRISAAMDAQLPDGMSGNAIDNDCDAGEGACIDNAEASEIENFEKFKLMVSEGYSIEEIRANFASEAEFDFAANHFVGAIINSLGQFTPPFGSVDFEDDICKFIKENDEGAVADLVMGDVVTLWEAQKVHRMVLLLSSSMPAGVQLVADSGMITHMDEIMGFVHYDSSTGYYVFNVDSPVFQAVDAMVKATLASMPLEERNELLNKVTESVA